MCCDNDRIGCGQINWSINQKRYCVNLIDSGQRDRFYVILFAVFSFITTSGLTVFSQSNSAIYRVDTELVTVEISVSDKAGKPVRNLTSDEFRIFVDGIERRPDFFTPIKKRQTGRPMSIVFALDVSGSMTVDELARLKGSLQNFVDRLADYNSYFAIMTFAMDVKTVQSFTNRKEKLVKAFDKIRSDQDGLSTHAYDAVDDAIRLIDKKAPRFSRDRLMKRAVIVISDGFPVGDVVDPSLVIERANRAETTIYGVILPSYSRLRLGKKPLLTPFEASGLVEKTGGRSLYATDKSFEPLFSALAEEITATYAVAFYPDEAAKKKADNQNVQIESRRGYTVRQNRTTFRLDVSEKPR